ncbi:MAG: VWA domain-containing protein [Thermomicrobiales bacterium]|nr:VWA domain-containing protein [Thermomicrobiales bacterium]
MPYESLASSSSPALIIYVLDTSASMQRPLGNATRIDVVLEAFRLTRRQMVFRSTRGERIAPRYRLALFAYNDAVYDMLDGVRPIDEVARKGIPSLSPAGGTATERAFKAVERLLQQELRDYGDGPAPLVFHMTDGAYTGEDPVEVVNRIRAMETNDGPPLVENLFIAPRVLKEPIEDVHQWPGITQATEFASEEAAILRSISSPLPASYRQVLSHAGYRLADDALMMLPGEKSSLVELGMAMSAATPFAR